MHVPVLLHETLALLDPKPGQRFIDATGGGGGHAEEIAKRIGSGGELVVFDADQGALERVKTRLPGTLARARFINANFRTLGTLREEAPFDGILFDIGLSSDQLEHSGRGFSFRRDEPLDMRFSGEGVTAAELLAAAKEEELVEIFRGFGEERYAGRIARRIVEERKVRPIESTTHLAELVRNAVPGRARHSRLDPATRVFQALRIAVNDELGALREGLEAARGLVRDGGRIAVITFHSLEDRIVKHFFRYLKTEGHAEILTKKAITPTDEEIAANPRSRSAKLRAIKIKHGTTTSTIS